MTKIVREYNISTGHTETVWQEDANHAAAEAEMTRDILATQDTETDHVYYVTEEG